MKIAIATPVLYDRTSPFNHLFRDIIGGFLKAGHTLIRFVAVRDEAEDDYMFGYSEGVEYKKYIRRESGHGNVFSRFLRDTVTNIREALGIMKSDADVLFEDVSYSSFWVVRAAKKKNIRVVAMLQDIWPDNAVRSGLLSPNGLAYRFFEILQRYVYRNADRIICISDDMKGLLVSKGVAPCKVEIIYNWGYSDETVDIPWEKNQFVQKYGLCRDIFYVVYAGNIGKMQNVELIVRAAKRLANETDIHFLIVGDGAKRKDIEKMTRWMDNLTMLPLQPEELATHVYSMAGVNVIPLVEGGSQTAMPSKTGVVLSCGRPAIFGFGSESSFAEILKQYGAGTCVSAVDESELAAEIIRIRSMNIGKRVGDELFVSRFRRSENTLKYADAVSYERIKGACNEESVDYPSGI